MTARYFTSPMLVKTAAIFVGSALLLVAAVPVIAHHAFGAEFDPNRPILLKGSVTKIEWVNPHSWIHMNVTGEDGTEESWMVEGGTPNTLVRRGLTRDTLKPGTYIIVDGYQSKDRSLMANGRDVTLADGSQFFMGTSGSGAPKDGKDPREPKRPKN